MAAGDVAAGTASVAASGTYDIKPSSGVEWVLHNVYYYAATVNVKLSMTDGTNVVDFDSDTSQGGRLGMAIHVTNAYWLRVTNLNSGAAVLIAYDGVQTK